MGAFMNKIVHVGLYFIMGSVFAQNSVYCPVGAQSVSPGMTIDQVMRACGQPASRQESKQAQMQKIPVTQLIYNSVRSATPFDQRAGLDWNYNIYSLPTNQNAVYYEINIQDNKVFSLKLNSSNSNAISLCDGVQIEVGDSADKVFGACGNPDQVNETFIEKPIPSQSPPMIWTYQFSPYQPPVNMTFVDGILQTIQ
jgi:hypothetical protein